VDLRLNTRATAQLLLEERYDEVVLATGIVPRKPPIEGIDHPKTLGYLDVLRDGKPVGERVAIIGAGGIGFDVAEYITQHGESASQNPEKFFAEWGIDPAYANAGGLSQPRMEPAPRQVHLLQRKESKVGDGLGKTTGWIHRTALKARGVGMSASVKYRRIDDDGLHVTIAGIAQTLPVDNVVICAGQEPLRELADALQAAGRTVHLIGGACEATELDAKRAIHQGTTLAASL
jgi:2,4-dienoyl-CoA reductase (NADPH2)